MVVDVQIWTSFDPILEWLPNKGLGMGHNIPISKKMVSIKGLENIIIIEFDLSVQYSILYTTCKQINPILAQFWSQGLLNFQILGIYGDLKNAFGESHVGQNQVS